MLTGPLPAATATMALAVGLMFALVCYLVTNLSPGGMITPGWLAVTLAEDPLRVVVIAVVTVAVYVLTLLLQRVVILYGKRLFAAVMLVSVLLSTALFLVVRADYPLLFSHQTLGFLIPGLVGYQMVRQPTLPTVLLTSGVSAAAYGLLAGSLVLGLVGPT